MVADEIEEGFTVIEMVVTMVIMALFLTLFFQMFFSSQSQQTSVFHRATANDIARTNLRKISSKTTVTLPACINTSSSPNNPLANSSATGSIVATDTSGGTPTWSTAGLSAESLDDTELPPGTTQTLKVLYPRGCASAMPAEIISIVSYKSETVSHAAYIN